MKGGDFSWPPVGTFRGHQWGPQLATSEYFLMATDIFDSNCSLLSYKSPLNKELPISKIKYPATVDF